jgi:hypothetical protein
VRGSPEELDEFLCPFVGGVSNETVELLRRRRALNPNCRAILSVAATHLYIDLPIYYQYKIFFYDK